MQIGDWVSYDFRDRRGTLRSITGVVVAVTGHGLVSVRSDGGQPGYKRGVVFSTWPDALRFLKGWTDQTWHCSECGIPTFQAGKRIPHECKGVRA